MRLHLLSVAHLHAAGGRGIVLPSFRRRWRLLPDKCPGWEICGNGSPFINSVSSLRKIRYRNLRRYRGIVTVDIFICHKICRGITFAPLCPYRDLSTAPLPCGAVPRYSQARILLFLFKPQKR